MIGKIVCNIRKLEPGRKFWSEDYLLSSLFINQSITKKLPIETLLEMVDSSVENYGKFEYDK